MAIKRFGKGEIILTGIEYKAKTGDGELQTYVEYYHSLGIIH